MSRRLEAGAAPAFQAQVAAPLFAALGDTTRLDVLMRLSRDGPGSIAHLSAASAVSRQAISKHLKVLADAGYVDSEWRGREHVWRMRPERLDDARAMLERISREWDLALDRLKRFVEE
jgi:DNA-binding transcriptional ArsR family regulator